MLWWLEFDESLLLFVAFGAKCMFGSKQKPNILLNEDNANNQRKNELFASYKPFNSTAIYNLNTFLGH